jgi:UDP-glucose 4-epimerase
VPVGVEFYQGSIADDFMAQALEGVDACIHFAAYIAPGESMEQPEKYFVNNVAATLTLIDRVVAAGVTKFVFSSSCAVYGDSVTVPIDESHPVAPHSPYGESKLMIEQALRWMSERRGLRAAALRYFNAAGGTLAHPERHRPEIHLIPLAFEAAAGRRDRMSIFGDDYPTRDGTCVRDYVHVLDLARAHVLALDALDRHPHLTLNLGSGTGYSNREVMEMVRRVTGVNFELEFVDRRPGDPAEAVASNELARETLGWELEIVGPRDNRDRRVAGLLRR